jgi:hypothetical protein
MIRGSTVQRAQSKPSCSTKATRCAPAAPGSTSLEPAELQKGAASRPARAARRAPPACRRATRSAPCACIRAGCQRHRAPMIPEVMRATSLDHASSKTQTSRGLQSAPTPQTTWSTASPSSEVVCSSQESRSPMSATRPIGSVYKQDARHMHRGLRYIPRSRREMSKPLHRLPEPVWRPIAGNGLNPIECRWGSNEKSFI